MKPLYARPLTYEEREKLEAGLKAAPGFEVRRSQIILMSANERLKAEAIGQRIGLSGQQVRRVLQAFNQEGVKGLERASRARHDDQRAFDDVAQDRLREIVRQSPRAFGYKTGLWTLDLLAEVAYLEGLTTHRVHRDTVSATLANMGITWQRAKHWINSPDPNYAVKKMSLDGCYEGPGRNVMALPMDGAFDAYNLERMRSADTVLLGHNSYQMFSSFWPAMADNPDASPTHREFSRLYNQIDKVAVSHRMTEEDTGPWRDTTRIIGGDQVYDEIVRLKDKPGKDIIVFGSRALRNDLLAHGLVDELHFMIGNVVLGDGTPILIEPIAYNGPKLSLRLVDVRQFEGSENLLVQYEVKYKNAEW